MKIKKRLIIDLGPGQEKRHLAVLRAVRDQSIPSDVLIKRISNIGTTYPVTEVDFIYSGWEVSRWSKFKKWLRFQVENCKYVWRTRKEVQFMGLSFFKIYVLYLVIFLQAILSVAMLIVHL